MDLARRLFLISKSAGEKIVSVAFTPVLSPARISAGYEYEL